jgi:transposase
MDAGPDSYNRALIGVLGTRLRVWFQRLESMSLAKLLLVTDRHKAIPFRRVSKTLPLGQGLSSAIDHQTGGYGMNTKPKKKPDTSKNHYGVHPSLKRVNLNAAGIDIGSAEHYVAVPEDRDEKPVRVFKCFTPDLHRMAQWLKRCGIETVAMESTGVYWIPVWQVLEQYGLEVKLVNARHVKNVPGRKTDVQDCQWLQELHTYGLLSGSFLPDQVTSVLRSYWRHRGGLVESCAKQIHLMQKALTLMNLHLHKAISDITGVTGLSIIRAIVKGERNPKVLAQFRHPQVKCTEEEMVDALTGNYREEHIFALKQAIELYDVYQGKIKECDDHIAAYMATVESQSRGRDTTAPKPKGRTRRKNEVYFDLRTEQFRLTGVDLTRIDGLDAMTVQTILSECGFDMSPFPTEKHFASWLGLCPNNRKTGGQVKRTKTKKVKNRAAHAFRLAARSLHSSLTALGAYFRRMRQRLGAPKAITATAHKLARLFYRMLKFGQDYVDRGQAYYEQAYHQRVLNNLKQRAHAMGYILVQPQNNETLS